MKHAPITETVHRLVREVACTQCYQRPPGSEALGPDVRRSCEPACPLFFHLPTLLNMAGQVGEAPGACETEVRQTVCGGCQLRPTAGEYCADYAARTCPVSRYSGEVIAAIQRLARVAPAGRE
jgi:hypothetical protein